MQKHLGLLTIVHGDGENRPTELCIQAFVVTVENLQNLQEADRMGMKIG